MDSDTELEGVREALDYYNRITHSPLCVSDGTSSTSSLEGNNNDVPGIIIMYDTETEENRIDNPILQECDRCDITFSDIQDVEEHRNNKKKRLESRSQIIDPQKSLLYKGDEVERSTENGENSELGKSDSERLTGAWSRNQHHYDERKFVDLRGDDKEKDRFQSKRSGDEEFEGIQMAAADDYKEPNILPRNDDEAMAVDSEREGGNRSADRSKTEEQLYFASRRVAKRASRGCVALCCIALLGTFEAKSGSLLLLSCLNFGLYTSSPFVFLFLLYYGY
jgi:hypothetical protein